MDSETEYHIQCDCLAMSQSKEQCDQIAKDPKIPEYIYQKTGLHLSPYFTAPKVQWILNNVKDAKTRLYQEN